jgi:hypothetical protein
MDKVFHGQWQLLLKSFIEPSVSPVFYLFYRPLIEITYAFDYLIWAENPFGYHLSNICFHILASIFLFLFIERLTNKLPANQSYLLAFMTAVLFAASPLHGEPLIWLSARGDTLAALFSFVAAWQFLINGQKPNKISLVISLISFFCALLAKESAICLPFFLLTLSFLFEFDAEKNIFKRLKQSLKTTMPYWLLLLFYVCLRAYALGDLIGGYTGSVAEWQTRQILDRLFEGSLLAVFYPYNQDVLHYEHLANTILRISYCLIALIVLLRTFRNYWTNYALCLLAFSFIWFIIAFLPTAKVWYLNSNLDGNRYLYISSAALSLFFAILIAPIYNNKSKFINAICLSAFCTLFISSIYMCKINNLPWLEASNHMKKLASELQDCFDKYGFQKIMFLNPPIGYKGAHMFSMREMLVAYFDRPIFNKNISQQIITIEPKYFSQQQVINLSKLKRLLHFYPDTAICAWDEQTQKLSVLNDLPERIISAEKHLSKEKTPYLTPLRTSYFNGRKRFIFSATNLDNTLDIDFIEIIVQADKNNKDDFHGNHIILSWAGPNYKLLPLFRYQWLSPESNNSLRSYIFPVSESPGWLLSPHVNQIALSLPSNDPKTNIASIKLLKGTDIIAQLEPDVKFNIENENGVCSIKDKVLKVKYDVSHIPQAKAAIIEISKCHYVFEHESNMLHNKDFSNYAAMRWYLPNKKGQLQILANMLPEKRGRYQIRLVALSSNNKIVGCFSDPLTIEN